ncbi:MAG: ATP-binding protein [Defluviitaleaceae bacterium]|nr:ATP-binding protein [Defluviitaleaceae bacterium]MCL2264103.1 ATP-binding protein [Defluviitaleaceae bacterium]
MNIGDISAQEHDLQDISRVLFEASPHGLSIWNGRYEVVTVNKQLLSIFGAVDEAEFIESYNRMFVEYQPTGMLSQDFFMFNMKRAFDGETVRFEWMSQTMQGDPLPLELTMVRYLKGYEFFVAIYTIDLRQVKSTMEKLHESDERAQILIGALPIPSAMVDSDYNVIECNQAAVDLLALKKGSPFEYSSPTDYEVFYCDSRNCPQCEYYQLPNCVARRCLLLNWIHTFKGYKENPSQMAGMIKEMCDVADEQGKSVSTNYRQTLMGEELLIETTLVPAKYKGQQVYVFYLRDLRETQLREIAEEESRAKTRFLARMSHEIRTPMNAILGISGIQLQNDHHPPDTEDAFLRIHHSSRLLLSLINDILDLSKVEAGKMDIVPQPYELSNMLIETVQLNMIHLGGKDIKFELEVDKTLPRQMIGDELRIKQVMNNVISNAFKYTEKGSVTLAVWHEEAEEENALTLAIEVTDTGQGMSKSQLNTLFGTEFNRHNMHLNRDIQGAGLGMTITYMLVNLMGGKINVTSTPGQGSKFTVRIPQKIYKNKPLGELAAQLQDVDAVRHSLRKAVKVERDNLGFGSVLVVDDIESNLFVAKGFLAPYRLSVDTASGGYEALAKVQSGKQYDIIFMDHMMPDLDGIETTKRIREEGYTTPIVALTANILATQEEIFLSNGFSGFLPKPIDANKLDDCLNLFIKNKNADGEKLTRVSEYAQGELSDALVASFLRDAERVSKILADIYISQNYDKDDLRIYTINAHAMKSALANVNENALSDTAYALETAGREGNIDKIKAETGLFLEKLAEVVEKLKPEFSPDTPDEDPDFLQKQLQEICTACENYNKKAAKVALAALAEKTWSLTTRGLLDEISAALLHSEFEQAEELARRFAV